MTKTRAELIERTLDRLGVTGLGRPAYPNETARVSMGVEPCLAELRELEIVYVPDPEAIEDAVFESLATMLADNVKAFFGLAQIAEADGTPSVPLAERKLRALGFGKYSGAVQRGEYM